MAWTKDALVSCRDAGNVFDTKDTLQSCRDATGGETLRFSTHLGWLLIDDGYRSSKFGWEKLGLTSCRDS